MPDSRLPVLPAIQLLALAMTAGVYASVGGFKWLIAVYIFAFSHYLIGAWYSRRYVFQLLSNPQSYLPLAVIALAGWLAYTQSLALMLYFGVHHALSESYLGQRNFRVPLSGRTLSALQTTRFWFHLAGFILLIRHDGLFAYDFLILPALFISLVCLLLLARSLWVNRANLISSQLTTAYFSEALLIVALIVSLVYHFSFLQVVFYHFAVWLIIPMLSIGQGGGSRALGVYIFLTVVTLALFAWLSPYHTMSFVQFNRFEYWFVLLSYAHITLSFVLSSANPQWIVSLFNRPHSA